jgi:hypothetical protein
LRFTFVDVSRILCQVTKQRSFHSATALQAFQDSPLSEKEHMELADALLENKSVTYLELMNTDTFTKISVEAIANYVRTSKRLQRLRWKGDSGEDDH